ncbi:MAG: hypothetical protein FJY29_05875 [Betaproteobacteria bacterium]|nr:hypothetical protein [Betaproteobacteria bacterium]
MNTSGKYIIIAATLLGIFTSQNAEAFFSKEKQKRDFNSHGEALTALGIVDVYPFEEKHRALRCTAFHLGDGYVATAGHCFLGAQDCNGALVRWHNSNVTSKCQKMLYSNASESFARGNEFSNDLSVFEVDVAPAQKFLVTSERPFSDTLSRENVRLLRAQLRSGKVEASYSETCQLVTGRITNIFGQPKAQDTAVHTCTYGDFADGSPLIDINTKTLLALHQGTSLLPAFDSTSDETAALKSINFAKTISELDILRIINSKDVRRTQIRIGGFSSEVFSTGLYEKISMKVATLNAFPDSETVSFSAHNGIDSQLEISGADGAKMIFAGPRRAGYEQRFQFKAPVQIVLKSAHTGIAPSAWIENIQSP